MNKCCSILLEVKIMLWSKGSKNERKKMMPSRKLVYGSGHEWLSKVYHEQNDLTQPQCINNKDTFLQGRGRKGAKNYKLFCKPRHFYMWNQRYEYRVSKYRNHCTFMCLGRSGRFGEHWKLTYATFEVGFFMFSLYPVIVFSTYVYSKDPASPASFFSCHKPGYTIC